MAIAQNIEIDQASDFSQTFIAKTDAGVVIDLITVPCTLSGQIRKSFASSTATDFVTTATPAVTTGGHTIVTKNNVSLTSTSGTNMRFRIKTLVQSVSLQTRIHAVSLWWS